MMSFTSLPFHALRQSGTRRHVASWSAPRDAIVGDVCQRTEDGINVESTPGTAYDRQLKRSNGAGSANGGRTP
ncbi:MAG: hypothetical protein ABI664_12495 [bacterium]